MMDVTLTQLENSTEIYAEADTGNKQWVAVITDTHPTYNYEREFVAYQKPKTSKRDSGRAELTEGDVVEKVRYTHSGKNDTRRYYQFAAGELHEIDETEITQALEDVIVETEPETHECEECGDEFDSEHGVAVHAGLVHKDEDEAAAESDEEPTATDADSQPAIVADGGTDEIRSYDEVRHTDDEVRHYSADGRLYAYREDGEHVVVSRGNEPATRWVDRVPAERTAVLADEHLWTIPDNWEERVRITGADVSRYAIYQIPESGVDVLVTVPNKNHLVDAWYGVKSVGDLSVTYADACDWDRLEDLIGYLRDEDDVADDVVDALEQLSERREHFERTFAEDVGLYAEDALFEGPGSDVARLDGWEVDPWGDSWMADDRLLADVLDVDDDTLAQVAIELNRDHIVPAHPTVTVGVDDRDTFPKSYEIRALTEAGCTPPEALDYLMVEIHGMSQSTWAGVRGISQPSVSNNVNSAKRKLKK